jgi:hypothetical protein
MLAFLGFKCPAPYKLYTDSQASLSIAINLFKIGKIRHIAIRYHLVRCLVAIGLLASGRGQLPNVVPLF